MAKLGDFFTISSGGTPSKNKPEYYENGTIPWVKTGDLKSKYISSNIEKITQTGVENSSAKVFPKNTVLLAMYGATIGACSILQFEATTNQACAAFLPCDKVLPNYLYYFLSSKKERFVLDGVGGAQPNISAGYLKNIEFDLLPLETQKQIAANLDKVTHTIDLCNNILEKLDLLVKARFVEMFGEPVLNPKGWEMATIGDIVTEVKYGTSHPAVEGGKYAYLRMNNLTYDGHLDLTDLKRIDIPENEIEKCVVRKGDVLFNRTNSVELVGKTCVFDEDEDMVIAGYIIRVRLKPVMLSLVLSCFMNTDALKAKLRDMAKGAVNQANINAQELQSIKVYLPPLDLQNQFAAFVEQTDKSKSAVKQVLEKAETLKKALMQEYFG